MAHEVLVPPLGQTTNTVVLVTWYRQAGDLVTQGEPLFAIETDKATLDIEAQATGVLAKVTAQAGDVVSVLSTIGVIAHAGEGIDSLRESAQNDQRSTSTTPDRASTLTQSTVQPAPGLRREGQRMFISPRAKRLAESTGLSWRALAGTGPEGAIVERDVRQALASASTVVLTTPDVATDTHAAEPKAALTTAGSGQLSAEVDVSLLVALRGRLHERGVVLTLGDIVLFVVTRAMGRHPATFGEAVGLLVNGIDRFDVAVIADPAHKSLSTLSREIAGMASRPVNQQETGQSGPALVVADIGHFGLDTAGTLAACGAASVLSIGRERKYRDGGHSLWVTLGYSHAQHSDWRATQFMNTVVQLIEDPDLLF